MKAKYVLIISYFYILLFVYAAISKLITFEAFQVQLTQSPLLSAYANIIAYLVIIVELVIALLLSLKQTKTLGLYLSYGLMVAFTIYIYLILNYSDFIPCSCGGILEKMGWTEHLWFNIIVSLLVLVALFFHDQKRKRFYLVSILTTIISSLLVILLFLSSEHIIKKENPFIRRYLPHVIDYPKVKDLGFNSFYFAGVNADTIYLGNTTAPLLLTSITEDMQFQDEKIVEIPQMNLNYTDIKLQFLDSLFFVSDGTVSRVFKGILPDVKTKVIIEDKGKFTKAKALSNNKIAFIGQLVGSNQSVLGLFEIVNDSIVQTKINSDFLEKQVDGVFDVDGNLSFDTKTSLGVYTYNYRNEFLVFDSDLSLISRGNTIDTISKAQVKVIQLKDGTVKMSSPSNFVNSKQFAYNGDLFNHSKLKGKNESKSLWDESIVIDVYDYQSAIYRYSFSIPIKDKKLFRDFWVTDQYFYILADKELIQYRRMRK
ncbi:hypothetical protein GJV76_11755 [Myroides sp. BIT-d1]|uniref:Methylamine utilisation protein MauE domain-containing protein n=1 Tax=Myroides albus TaxID=2562892 RepID=A0A6I3LMT2_9FLAO|nr:MauE/DoxX family redox-associated membrane protein [Myroides albus]MTG98796.1 hypothetical protein [Myroides albus]